MIIWQIVLLSCVLYTLGATVSLLLCRLTGVGVDKAEYKYQKDDLGNAVVIAALWPFTLGVMTAYALSACLAFRIQNKIAQEKYRQKEMEVELMKLEHELQKDRRR